MVVIHSKNLRNAFASFIFISFSLPVFATPLWQGPYVGAYLGGGFGSNHASTNVGTVTSTSYFLTPADIGAVNGAGSSDNTPSSIIAGVELGHDWVKNQMVYGGVIDYGALPLTSSATANANYPSGLGQYSVHTSMSTNWLLTLRGRAGYQVAWHWPSLFYVTGGLAVTQLKVNNSFSDNTSLSGVGGTNTAENQMGWTAGVGAELIAFCHASVALEYLYVKVPSVKTSSVISNSSAGFGIPVNSLSNGFATTGDFHANLLKLSLNYRFDE